MKSFKPIKGYVAQFGHIPKEFLHNNDVANLYWLCILVQEGPDTHPDIVKRFNCTPGKVTPARWLTCASNILVYYMQSEESENTFDDWKRLTLLVKVIVRVYAPSIFNIKENWIFANGPVHFHNNIIRLRQVLKNHPTLFGNVKTTLQTNAYFCHLENILVGMVHVDDPKINKKAIKIIEELRKQPQPDVPRYFIVPEINIDDSEHFWDLIDLDNIDLSQFVSPPILSAHTIEDLKNKNFHDDYLKICCHSQHVERWVGITSEAAKCAVGHDRRHHWILNKVKTCEAVPTNFKKSHWSLASKVKNKVELE